MTLRERKGQPCGSDTLSLFTLQAKVASILYLPPNIK